MFTTRVKKMFTPFKPDYTVFADEMEKQEVGLANIQVLTEQLQLSEASSRRKTRIVSVVAEISKLFLSQHSVTDEMIICMLGSLGEIINSDRVYIFENEIIDNDLVTSVRFEWKNGDLENMTFAKNVSYEKNGLTPWVDLFRRNEIVIGDTEMFEGPEREFLNKVGVDSILLVPISVAKEWTGFLGFESCNGKRYWAGQEQDALRMCSDIFGAAIYSERTTKALQEKVDECLGLNIDMEKSKDKYKSLFTNSVAGICRINFDTFKVVEINQRGAELFGYRSWKDVRGKDIRNSFENKKILEELVKELNIYHEINNTKIKIKNRKGKHIWVKLSCKIIKGDSEADSVFISIAVEREAKKALEILTEAMHNKKLGSILVEKGFVTEKQIHEALKEQRR